MISLSIIIPARNEENCIAAVIQEIHTFLNGNNFDYEIIVVNDGSTDRTGEIVKNLCISVPYLRIIETNAHKYYGGAWRI